jgi:hypothetical protein
MQKYGNAMKNGSFTVNTLDDIKSTYWVNQQVPKTGHLPDKE